MPTPKRPLAPEAVTIALRQLLDHIDDHALPLPTHLRLPDAYATEPRIDVSIYAAHLEVWHASVEVVDERVDHRVIDGNLWAMALTECRLPVGVRLLLRSAVRVEGEVLSHG